VICSCGGSGGVEGAGCTDFGVMRMFVIVLGSCWIAALIAIMFLKGAVVADICGLIEEFTDFMQQMSI